MGQKSALNLGLRRLSGAVLALIMVLQSGTSVSADMWGPELNVVAFGPLPSVRDGESCRRRGQVTGTVKQQFVCVWAKTTTASGRIIGRRLVWKLQVPKSQSSVAAMPSTTTTSTTNPRETCATGGECRVGDIGAGGGVVFCVSPTPQWWGRYMEAAPNRWNDQWGDNALTSGCYGLSIPGASATGLGSGQRNTEAIVAACPERNIAARVADDLVLNGKSDWFLPSRDELNAMYPHRAGIGVQVAEDFRWYASSTFSSALTHCVQVFTDDTRYGTKSGTQYCGVHRSETNRNFVRPIRYGQSSTTNAVSTTTTLARLTCATGGECRVGDIGAGGGVVFYVPPTPQWWGRYMEAAPNRWNGQWGDVRHVAGCNGLSIPGASAVGMGSGMRNTEAIVTTCPESSIAARVANDLVLNGKSDWFLPSRDELNAMYPHRAGIGMRLTEDNQVYTSSTFSSALTFWGQLFTDDAATGNKSGQQFGSVPRTYSYFVRPIRYGN